MRLIDADAYSAEMKDRQEAAWKWRNEAIAEEDELKLARAEGAFTAFTEANLTMDKHIITPWHRVEEGLPTEVGSYLVYAPTYTGGSSSAKECKAGVMFASWLKGGHWSIEVGYYKRPGCVTHWMPLPEPPKEDA